MEFRSLQYFISAAKYENLTKASEELNITQPALSRQIKLLEEELGTDLFVRKTNRRLILTEAGKKLLKHAEEICRMEKSAVQDISSLNSALSGTIRIGTSESMGTGIISEMTTAFRKLHPHVKFFYHLSNATRHMKMLEENELDFSVILRLSEESSFNSIQLPETTQQVILMKKDSPLAAKTSFTAEDLKMIPLLIPNRVEMCRGKGLWDENVYDSLNIIGTFNLAQTALPVLDQEYACMIVTESFARLLDNAKYSYSPLWPEKNYECRLIWKEDNLNLVQTRAFARFVESWRTEN